MAEQRWVADVGVENARWLATESRTARLAREYRPMDLGEGRLELSARALGASRELGEEETATSPRTARACGSGSARTPSS